MTSLICGVNGFVGHHLARTCSEQGQDIVGFGYQDLQKGDFLEEILSEYHTVDLTDASSLQNISLSDVSVIYHLAGLAAVGPSFDQPGRYMSDNTAMLITVAEKALADKCKARIIVISSGSIYDPEQSLPINEDGKLSPSSPYSVSKISTELLCEYYKKRRLDIVIARPFNHIGPGQGLGFILPDLAAQALEYKNTGSFKVGNLKTKRDYTDVRDVVNAYSALASAQNLKHGVYNICSSKSYSGEEILSEICKHMNISDPKIEVDQSKIRPKDILDIRGDNTKLRQETDWSPQISLQRSVADYIDALL